MAVTLRPISPEDEPFLSQVYASTRQEELALVEWDEAQKTAFLRMQFAAQHRYYQEHYPHTAFQVILRDGQPIGPLYVPRGATWWGIWSTPLDGVRSQHYAGLWHKRSRDTRLRSKVMAKLPNGARALIPMEKLTDYCLNPGHARGKDKARVFAAVLGITRDKANELADLVQQAARDGDITQETSTVWGQYYRVDWAIPLRVDVVLRTIWEIAPGEAIPRLVSVFLR